ncbi:NAD(P)-binding domain-containing protein [Streptomyces sp. NPDC058375]|uniref:NAD(P)-binding domain-containing protein n=1 Tax=Streptomyces sp. NPDC058375 TaxID=3346467 RepID=UPI00364C89C8
MTTTDVVVIGGGQAGLAAGYHLRRQNLAYVILDAQSTAGGAWQHTWDSLHLFSPAGLSSLPGRLMPAQPGQEYPDAAHVVDYLSDYEQRYSLPVHRPATVRAVHRDGTRLRVETDAGHWSARAVISATGTWWRPFLPAVPGQEKFTGRQLHTTGYRRPSAHGGSQLGPARLRVPVLAHPPGLRAAGARRPAAAQRRARRGHPDQEPHREAEGRAPDGQVRWRSRRQLHQEAAGDRQMLFVCATRFDKYVEASFGSYVTLRHHQVGERTGRPDSLRSVGVMLTPDHSGSRPRDTTPVRVLGPSHLTSEQVTEFEELWPQSGSA